MFRRLHETPLTISITINGTPATAAAGDTVAAALLLAGCLVFRRTVTVGQMQKGEARGPYCAMGTCFECLVTIDGVPSQQACLVPVRDGMAIATADLAIATTALAT